MFFPSSAYSLLQNTGHSFNGWLYLLLALLVAVEGPLATLVAAVAASSGVMDIRLVFLAASCGNLSADILWYLVGYTGKLELLAHYGSWLGLKQDVIFKLKQGINDHVGKFLFVAKLTLGLVVPTLIAAGLAHVPWRRWVGILFLAESIWTGTLVLSGYYYGQYILQLENGLKWLSIASTLVLIILIGFYMLRSRSRKDNQ